MRQRIRGHPATALMVCFLGLPPAFASDWQAGGISAGTAATVDFVGSRPCPTRFDYVVLASFSDASSLLSLSSYHFRSEVGFSSVPLTGWQRVDFKVESGECRPQHSLPRTADGVTSSRSVSGRAFRAVGSLR